MKSILSGAAAALGLVAAIGCGGAEPEPRMTPAAGQTPALQSQAIDITIVHGDVVTAIDEVLLVRSSSGPNRLMFFDGDADCEDVSDPNALPEGLVLVATVHESQGSARWTFHRGDDMPRSVTMSTSEASSRIPTPGDNLMIQTEVDGLQFEARGRYQPEICDQV